MPKKLHDCVNKLMDEGKTEEQAYAICNASIKDKMPIKDNSGVSFSDKAIWDGGSKSAISVRDGVLEYLGSEIGLEPASKTFTVYRSPATIAKAAMAMPGIALTNDHVEVGVSIVDACGAVKSSDVIDFFEDGTDSRLAIKNIVDINSEMLDTLQTGKKELSLGYSADLIPHDKYDFEQRNIEPHHLAVVDVGRCGSGCKFLDKKGIKMEQEKQMFQDADGGINLEQIIETITAIQEAVKVVPISEVAKIMPKLQELVAMAQAGDMPEPTEEPGDEMAGESVGSDVEDSQEGESMTDEGDMEEDEGKKKKGFGDADFVDAVNKAVTEKVNVINKAKEFVDSVDVNAPVLDIMRAALATEHDGVEFADSEVAVAFKMLKKQPANYANFADKKRAEGAFSALAGKKLQ